MDLEKILIYILIGIFTLGTALSGCSGPKKIGEDRYKFTDQELRLDSYAHFDYPDAPDSTLLKYRSDDLEYHVSIKVPKKDNFKWHEKFKGKKVSFEAKKVERSNMPLPPYYKVNNKTIKIR